MDTERKIIPFRPLEPDFETEKERARRIEELRRKVRSGDYLIRTQEIIEGLLDAMIDDLV